MFEGLRFTHWKPSLGEDGVLLLALDRAGSTVNALSRPVLDELATLVERLAIDPPRGVVIHSAKSDSFVVGADIREFQQFALEGRVLDAIKNGQQVFEQLARLPCPTVAAIHGSCLGGGTELALACRYRIASDAKSTRIGLPEVMLGIHPGWGGSARLPRLIGAPEAMKLMLTGAPATAAKARKLGLIDRVVAVEELLATARKLALKPAPRPLRQRLLAWSTNLWPTRQLLAPLLRRQTAAKVRKEHYPAPFALIEVWRRGGGSIGQRLTLEARSVAKLAATPTARNLIRVFFLQERLKGLGRGGAHGIQHVHVVGAGVMGGDIAAWCALKGFDVTLQDREQQFIEPALARARTLFEAKARGDQAATAAYTARLRADVAGSGVAASQLAIEAIFENREAKESLYASLEPALPADGLLASNTSSIPLDELSHGLQRPRQFLGLHFFNPVAKMPLVEVVRHATLDSNSEQRALAFVHAIGKLPVAVKGTPGFLVNRILMPYLLEAIRALSEGVPGAALDKAARGFGMPMGPIELADTVGLDVCASVGKELAPFLNLPLPDGVESLLAAGHRGKKTGQGFYIWQDGKPQKPALPEGYQAPADLADRLILPMLNEAIACLADGVVDDADLLDAGVIFGTGFAPFRGGPIQYIRDSGKDTIHARLEQLAQVHGERFKPKAGWDSAPLQSA
ncbi:MAG TPA: 3-hydroxyacyl-CoA dehydrogenase NAD-binding domain-containing protein [Rhodanobacteraceae bacterium]|nr:3-hydroxyacyl-CoA dehydrogenase NAD-binding domain-containing protein [Rhodanobacteraceae bacterium]